MMYFSDYANFEAMKEDAKEELWQGRRFNAKERAAQNRKVGVRLSQRDIEESRDYAEHHERLCDRADDQGLLHACNDTWLEVRTWNNDIRGIPTLFGIAVYWMPWWMVVVSQWSAVIDLYRTGLWVDGQPLGSTSTPLQWLISAIVWTVITAVMTWAFHHYLLRYELFTQRWIRLRFNRKTKKVYLLRPRYAGGLMVFDWTDTQPSLPKNRDPNAVCLAWQAVAWGGKELGQPTIFQSIGRRTSFKTAGDWMAFWEYIRRYMEEGPESVPKPKTLIGYWPSVKEAWISVTQWYPAFQQKGVVGAMSDGITLLILPLILLMFAGNFVGQCLTWQARFPKEIENAGRGESERAEAEVSC